MKKISAVLLFGTVLSISACNKLGQEAGQNYNQGLKTPMLTSLSSIVKLQGSDKDGINSSGAYGSKVNINFVVSFDGTDLPIGTKFTITPDFQAQETSIPDNFDWSFDGGAKSFVATVGDRDSYINHLTMIVKPNRKYYYHNFNVKPIIKQQGTDSIIKSDASVSVYLFGIMNVKSLGKLYFGEYNETLKSYTMPAIFGTPIVRDDGKMIINKLLKVSDYGYQSTFEIMNTLYDGNHSEKWLGSPEFSMLCPIYGADVIGTKIYAFANSGETLNKEVDWNSFSRVVATRECNISGNTNTDLFHVEDGGFKMFDPNIKKLGILSRDARYMVVNNKTVYDIINNISQDMLNIDRKVYVNNPDFGDFVQDVSDAGFVVAADMRKDSGTTTPKRDWILFSPITGSSSLLWHSEADINKQNSGAISSNGQYVFTVISKSGKNVLKAINRNTGDIKDDISIIGTDLNSVKIVKMTVSNQGTLQIQVEDSRVTPLTRMTKFYSFNSGKSADATEIVKFLGLSDYLASARFHGAIGVSPNGKAMGIYMTSLNDDQFNNDKMTAPTAIISYKFGSDYITEYNSFDDLISSIGN